MAVIFRVNHVKKSVKKTTEVYERQMKTCQNKESKDEAGLINNTSGIDGNCGKEKDYIQTGNIINGTHNHRNK